VSAYVRDLEARADARAPQPLPDPLPPEPQPHAALFAQVYARLGWHVLPIKPGAKRPLTRHGHKDATRDAVKIRAWWQRAPNANVGIAVEPSGLIVVDVDPRNGGSLDALPALPATLTAHTGGGGVHLFFRRPTPCPRLPGKLAAGIDLKTGGYILVAPSVTAGAYIFDCFDPLRDPLPDLAEYPLALLHGSEAAAAAPAKAISPSPRPAHKLPATIPQGGRNATLLRLAAGFVRRGIIGSELNTRLQRTNAERCQPPLGADEIDGICLRATGYGSSGFVMVPHKLLDSGAWLELPPAAQSLVIAGLRRAGQANAPFALPFPDFIGRPGFKADRSFYAMRDAALNAGFLKLDTAARRTQHGCTAALFTISPDALGGSLTRKKTVSWIVSRYPAKRLSALTRKKTEVLKALTGSCALGVCVDLGTAHKPSTQSLARLFVLADHRAVHIPSPARYYTQQGAA
jgi:hypothetical protein